MLVAQTPNTLIVHRPEVTISATAELSMLLHSVYEKPTVFFLSFLHRFLSVWMTEHPELTELLFCVVRRI